MKPLNPGFIETVMDCNFTETGNTLNKSLLLVSQGVEKRIFYKDIIYIESRNVDLYIVCSGNGTAIMNICCWIIRFPAHCYTG